MSRAPVISQSEDVNPTRRSRLRSRLASLTARDVAIIALAAAIFVAGVVLRARHVANPYPPSSADEHSYLALAHDLAKRGGYSGGMKQPWHWPPGAPALFALAMRIDPGSLHQHAPTVIYAAQAAVGSLTILVALAAGWLLAGAWAGLAAAAATAFYPPLIEGAGHALSEPLGALLLGLSLLALFWAARAPSARRLALGGALLGATFLVRADLLPVLPFLFIWAVVLARHAGWRRALVRGIAMLAGVAIIAGPWVAVISNHAGRLVPVSTSGNSAFYIGTYLPGHGTLFGYKRTFGTELRLEDPRYARVANFKLPQYKLLALVKYQHPGLTENAAEGVEARHNLHRYALGQPLAFAHMLVDKGLRMWTTPNRDVFNSKLSTWEEAVHATLVLLALLGLIGGLVLGPRGRGLGAVAILIVVSTVTNAVFLSEPRHLLPLLPGLFAAGAAGWVWMAGRLAGRRAAIGPRPEPAPAAG